MTNANENQAASDLSVSTGSMDWAKLSEELQKKSDQYWERGEANPHSRQYDFVASMVFTGLSDAIKNSIQSNKPISKTAQHEQRN